MELGTILVLGATGNSGLAFVDEALALSSPPTLILYVRTPTKLPASVTNHKNVVVVTGKLSDEHVLSAALKQHAVTTVISFLGAYFAPSGFLVRSKDTPIADSFPGIIRAMIANNVRRLLVLSTPAFWVDGRDMSSLKLSLFGVFPKLFAPQGDAEMLQIGKTVYATGNELDWTIFRIPHLTDGPADLSVWADYAGPDHKGSLNLSRRSLARWVLGEIENPKWIRGVPYLGNY